MDRPNQGLVIYGDHFNTETRVILTVLDVSGVKYKFELIDEMSKQHLNPKYLEVNPTGQIPTITEGKYMVLGGSGLYIQYLVNAHKTIKETLYPENNKAEIDRHLSWFQGVLRVCSTRIIKMTIGPKIHGEKAPTPEDLKAVTEEFFRRILNRFDQMLASKDFVCGAKMTVADIQYFFEIQTVVKLLKKEVSESEFPHVEAWMSKMQKAPEIIAQEQNFDKVCAKYSL